MGLHFPYFRWFALLLNSSPIEASQLICNIISYDGSCIILQHWNNTSDDVKKCPYLEFLLSVFSRIWTEYGDLQNKHLYSVRIPENMDQKNSIITHIYRSDCYDNIDVACNAKKYKDIYGLLILLRDCLQLLFLILSKYKQIHKLLFPLKLSKSHWWNRS